jgi:hypothetical protein
MSAGYCGPTRTKLPKIQQVIEHYATQKLEGDAEVVDLDWYRLWNKSSGKVQ